jgi:hypothetical protein
MSPFPAKGDVRMREEEQAKACYGFREPSHCGWFGVEVIRGIPRWQSEVDVACSSRRPVVLGLGAVAKAMDSEGHQIKTSLHISNIMIL